MALEMISSTIVNELAFARKNLAQRYKSEEEPNLRCYLLHLMFSIELKGYATTSSVKNLSFLLS